jgi:L-galactose dehydrogenase
MDYTVLGRTGLRVSRMGLGGGGHSRLGLSQGKTDAEAETVVREALALGVNFIDTAESYKTEEVIGRGIGGTPRDQVVLSTKAGVGWQERNCTGAEMRERVEACLKRLQTDYVDVFHLHGVSPEEYAYAREALVPTLYELREQFIADPSHKTLTLALQDDYWDVMMVGFSLLNPSARHLVFPQTQAKQIGTLGMFAVRRALSQPDALRELMETLVSQNQVSPNAFNPAEPLDFLTAEGVAANIPEAAYRFSRWEPGMDLTLSGTGNVEHLKANAYALNLPPLPASVLARLEELFGKVDNVSGN